MSFSLAVWSSRQSLTKEQAGLIWEQLCQSGKSSILTAQPDAQKRLGACLRSLERRYPSISSDKWTGETIDDCPWSSDFELGEDYIVLNCVWSWADDIASFVADLAYRHELVCYDPQTDSVRLPASIGGVRPEVAEEERPLTPAQKRKLKGQALKEIEAVIDPLIADLGFEKRHRMPTGTHIWGDGVYTRQINTETVGSVRWYDLTGSGSLVPEVTVWIGVRNQRLEKALAEQRGEKLHPYWPPSMEVEIGTVMGTTQRFYQFKDEERNEELAEQIAAAVQDYAIPFLEAHASLEALAAKAGQPYFHWNWLQEERAAMAQSLLSGAS